MFHDDKPRPNDPPAEVRKGRIPWHWLVLVAFVLGFVVCWLLLSGRTPPTFSVVCIPPIDGGEDHRAVPGEDVTLRAVVRAPPGTRLEYTWDFRDGSDPFSLPVDDIYDVGVLHTFSDATVGTVTKARITVRDLRTGEKHRAVYRIRFCEPVTETLVEIAREKALWTLHTSLNRADPNGEPSHGTWGGRDRAATTAFGALAFLLSGYPSSGDPATEPYAETVDRAMTFLLGRLQSVPITEQPAGDPDSNDNGTGLSIPATDSVYATAAVALAVIADGSARRVAAVGNKDADGMTHREIVRDIIDFLAFAQAESGAARGGWGPQPNKAADMSTTLWPVLAMLSAQRYIRVATPDWVRDDLLEHWLKYAQAPGGAFGDRDPNTPTVAATSAGLVALSFCKVTQKDDRVKRAVEAIAKRWETDSAPDLRTMYAVMKAGLLTKPSVPTFGDHDWRQEYTQLLLKTQTPTGRWPSDEGASDTALATAWGTLILTQRFFVPEEPAVWWRFLLLLIVLAALGFLLGRRWKRRRHAAREIAKYAQAQTEVQAQAQAPAEDPPPDPEP